MTFLVRIIAFASVLMQPNMFFTRFIICS